jgi:hypothetical protein
VTGDEVYRVILVVSETWEVRGVDAGFLYRGQLPDVGEEISVENEFKPEDRRRARVTQITRDHEPMAQGPLLHAIELG